MQTQMDIPLYLKVNSSLSAGSEGIYYIISNRQLLPSEEIERKEVNLTCEWIKSSKTWMLYFFRNAHVGSELAFTEQHEYNNSNV